MHGKHKTSETKEALTLMNWARMNPILDELLIHIANERHTSAYHGHQLKLQGVKAGVSDYFLPLPRGKYHGMWLELKVDKSARVQSNQQYWLAKMQANGYAAQIGYGAMHAIELVKAYLKETNHVISSSLELGICGRCDCCQSVEQVFGRGYRFSTA